MILNWLRYLGRVSSHIHSAYSKHFHCSEDKGQRGQWPKLSYIGKFFLLLLSLLICPSTPFEAENPASKLKSQSWGSNPSLEDEIQLKISKAGSASRFEKNSPPEVLRVIEGANHHWSRRSWFCSTEIRFLSPSALTLTKILNFLGAPKGPQNSPQRDFFMKKKVGCNR